MQILYCLLRKSVQYGSRITQILFGVYLILFCGMFLNGVNVSVLLEWWINWKMLKQIRKFWDMNIGETVKSVKYLNTQQHNSKFF
jgi:hypothetical protein